MGSGASQSQSQTPTATQSSQGLEKPKANGSIQDAVSEGFVENGIQVEYSKDAETRRKQAKAQFLKLHAKMHSCQSLYDFYEELEKKKKVPEIELEKTAFLLTICEMQFEDEVDCPVPPLATLNDLARTETTKYTPKFGEMFNQLYTCFDKYSDTLEKMRDREEHRINKVGNFQAEGIVPGFRSAPSESEKDLKSAKTTEAKMELILSNFCQPERENLMRVCDKEATNLKEMLETGKASISPQCTMATINFDLCVSTSLCADKLRKCMEKNGGTVKAYALCSQNLKVEDCQ
eukprot:TRINITY_DN236_c0_g1_i1.p1 TRINITY_DN236_c0_g1~~TRINITY_DN236_c0_g1_i1.p1  ORF type:complete len:291 (-),score=78.46 TRINITY_DN236_c0_g1_i1:254-1126(-)